MKLPLKHITKIAILVLIGGLLQQVSTQAQNKPAAKTAADSFQKVNRSGPFSPKKVVLKKAKDELQKCTHRPHQQALYSAWKARQKDGEERILSGRSLGNNPQEGQYRREMERLLGLEIENVKRAVKDVENKHMVLMNFFPELKNYQEIILNDDPGTFVSGVYKNSRRMIILHWKGKNLDCMVLETHERNIYQSHLWTRKIVRLYMPFVQFIELDTFRHNYKLYATLNQTSPEIQLRTMRMVFANLRSALYAMDILLSAFYDLNERKTGWQIDF